MNRLSLHRLVAGVLLLSMQAMKHWPIRRVDGQYFSMPEAITNDVPRMKTGDSTDSGGYIPSAGMIGVPPAHCSDGRIPSTADKYPHLNLAFHILHLDPFYHRTNFSMYLYPMYSPPYYSLHLSIQVTFPG